MVDEEQRMSSLPRFEEACADCDATGRLGGGGGPVLFCQTCEGTGFTLTPFGEEVFAFVQHTVQRYRFRCEQS